MFLEMQCATTAKQIKVAIDNQEKTDALLMFSSEVRTITYMEDRQLQHPENVNKSQIYDCSSEERTLFQYSLNNAEILGQSLVQMQLGRQQVLLYKEISP